MEEKDSEPLQSTAHVEELIRVGVYAEPDRRPWLVSKRLPEGIENVEILLGGEVFFEKEHQRQTFGRGTIFWHLGGEFDIWETVPGKMYRCAVFTFRVSKRVPPPAKVGNWQKLDTLESFVGEASELFQDPEVDRSMLTAWIYGSLLRQFIRTDHIFPSVHPLKLEEALSHIRSRFPEQPSLAELSDIVRISGVHLNRLFRQYFECSPAEYILKMRLEHAANLLTSRMDIQRIAEECRFQSTAGFYAAFRRHYAMTPGEYRARHKKEMNFPKGMHLSD